MSTAPQRERGGAVPPSGELRVPFGPGRRVAEGLFADLRHLHSSGRIDLNVEIAGNLSSGCFGGGEHVLVPQLERFDPQIGEHSRPHLFLESDLALRRFERLLRIIEPRGTFVFLFLAPDTGHRRARVGDRLCDAVAPAQINDVPRTLARQHYREHIGQQRRIGALQLLELHRKCFQAEHPVRRAAAAQQRAPQFELCIRRGCDERIRAVWIEIQIFERRTEATGAPQLVAEVRASGARHRGEQIADLRSLGARREVELPSYPVSIWSSIGRRLATSTARGDGLAEELCGEWQKMAENSECPSVIICG